MTAQIILFVPRPNHSRFAQSYLAVRKELAALIPIKPIQDQNECSDSNPQGPA